MSRASNAASSWRYVWIFAATVGGALLGPLLHFRGQVPVALWTIILAIMLGSLRALRAEPRLLAVVGVLGVVHLSTQMGEEFSRTAALLTLTDLTGMVFFGLISAAILRDIFQHDEITADMVFGASAVYLLIGSFFTRAYMLLELYAPGSFVASGAAIHADSMDDMTRNPLLLGYYSLVTLTTMGYGDMLPARPFSRNLAAMEAVLGQLYIAAVIARLVAIYTARGHSKGRAP